MDSIPDLIARYDQNLRRTYVNPSWERAAGLSSSDVLNEPLADALKSLNIKSDLPYEEKLREAWRTGRVQSGELSWINTRGVLSYINYTIIPECQRNGKVTGLLVVGHDITKYKMSLEKLAKAEERLRLTLEAGQIGTFDWDVKNDTFTVSPTYYTMLGYEPQAGLGDRKQWLQRVHPEDRPVAAREIQRMISRDRDEYSYEVRMLHADGLYRWQYIKGYGVEHDEEGKVTRVLGVRIDISERRQMEEALRLSARRSCGWPAMRPKRPTRPRARSWPT